MDRTIIPLWILAGLFATMVIFDYNKPDPTPEVKMPPVLSQNIDVVPVKPEPKPEVVPPPPEEKTKPFPRTRRFFRRDPN